MIKWIQLIIGILMFFFGIWLMYESMTMPTFFIGGILFGQGSVFGLWGVREFFWGLGSLYYKKKGKGGKNKNGKTIKV